MAALEAGDDPDGEEAESLLDFIRRRMAGDYTVDEFGFDPGFTERVFLRWPARCTARGSGRGQRAGERSSEGGAPVVGNHSGTIALTRS